MPHRFAVGHRISKDNGTEVLRPWYLARAAFPAGGLACDVKEMLGYARFHLGDGSPILKPETLAEMHATQFEKAGTDDEMAITWHVSKVEGTRILGHGVGTLGQISLLQFVPERDFAAAIVTNAGRGGEISRDVSRWAMIREGPARQAWWAEPGDDRGVHPQERRQYRMAPIRRAHPRPPTGLSYDASAMNTNPFTSNVTGIIRGPRS